jgi:uncharacterized protein (TIRG00374 family)
VTTDAPRRAWKRAAVRLGGSAAILAVLFWLLPLGELWAAMRRVPLGVLLLTLAAYMAAHTVAVAKWRLMVNTAGAGLDYRTAARCYFAGLFGNLFLPSVVGGDLIRAGLALKHGRHRAGALLASFVDRILDVAAIGLLAAIGALLLPRALDAQSRQVFFWLAALAAAGLIGLGALAAVFQARWFSHGKRRKLVKLRQAVRAMAGQPGRVLAVLLIALGTQGSFALLNLWIGRWCGLEVGMEIWLFAWSLGKVSAMLPVTQGGIGVREAALAALLKPFGVPAVLSVAVGLVWEVVIVAGGLIAGGLAWLAGRKAKARIR